ncbi:MAG: hypothetical protein AB9842_01760 [Bacteroidales bacterium]
MKTLSKILIVSAVLMIAVSCGKKKEGLKLITERIQYDVTIKSPDPDYDWWVQNLEGPTRESFVKDILNSAYSGKLKAYDIFHKPLTVNDVKAIGNRSDTITGTSPYPPYNDTVMVIKQELDLQHITRVRFLEEWRMDETSLQFEKKILGISPIIESYDEQGNLRGYMPLFWVYIDKDYPAKLQLPK